MEFALDVGYHGRLQPTCSGKGFTLLSPSKIDVSFLKEDKTLCVRAFVMTLVVWSYSAALSCIPANAAVHFCNRILQYENTSLDYNFVLSVKVQVHKSGFSHTL